MPLTDPLEKIKKEINVTWLPTRACKYNVSALGTSFECEGIKSTYLDFT